MNATKLVWLFAWAAASAWPSMAVAQADLIVGLGGPLDFGIASPARGDDTSTPTPVDLTPTFPAGVDFFGQHYDALYVNVNGSVTFGQPLATFTPDPFPLPVTSAPMIAAWWADVDTRPVPPESPDANQIYWAATPEHFVVTWADVGYYAMHTDLRNAFQIVLTPAASGVPGAFDVELRYHRCEWTTGDDPSSGGIGGLGGIAAQAGFDAADGTSFATLPGSRTAAVLDLCTTSNVGMPGVWSLSSILPAPVCGNGLRETGEACDDGNLEPHDFCDALCQPTTPCFTVDDDGGVHDPLAIDGASADAGLGPCIAVDAAVEMDAAVEPPDAAPTIDGGRRNDAGTRFDAGPPVDAGRDAGGPRNQLDVIGGGCGCRATSHARAGVVPLWVLLVCVVVRGRRGARARRT